MALELINQKIIGEIDNFQEKIEGKNPINRLELLYLINSWGRIDWFYTTENTKINSCKAKACYDLSKLDTSEITDMNHLFAYSEFNGDISNWNTSKVTNMSGMFYEAKDFNQDINSWDVSKVTSMSFMFSAANLFNKAILWNLSNINNITYMFFEAKAFENRFNDGNSLPFEKNNLKKWFRENRDKMLAIDINDREQSNLNNFYSNLNNIEKNIK